MRAPPSPRRTPAAICAALVLCLACVSEPTTRAGVPVQPPPQDRDVELFVQRRLQDARAFREQGRLEAAERALERALAFAPDDPEVLRLMGRVLEDQGRMGESRAYWARADAIDPPPPPPPDAPLAVGSEGVAVLLVDVRHRRTGRDARARLPEPDREAEILGARLATRLPWARVAEADPGSVVAARRLLHGLEARSAISLRTERGFCGYSRKDGDFAVAWLRVAAATPKRLVTPPTTVREVRSDPPAGQDACVRLVLAAALERVFAETDALEAVRDGSRSGAWPSPALRALFPGIGRRVAAEIERGRARLATGRVAEAAASFRAALAVDPDDADARAYLHEAEETLAIARALEPEGAGPEDPGLLAFSLTPAERAIAESLLTEERTRRDELLAALVITEVPERAPPPEAVATLRPVELAPPPAPGPQLAREQVEGGVEARALFTDAGEVATVYYFALGGEEALLREEDSSGDGRPDRWIAYRDGVRSNLWEDLQGDGRPDVRVQFAADGGAVELIEVDDDEDGVPERVFRYVDGRLASEGRDTDGDDALDRFETFDAEGRVEVREEDLNADGRIDVRSTYRDGKLQTREIEDPSAVEELLNP